MRSLLPRRPPAPRRRQSLWLLLFSAFGLGTAVGYAAGAQRSVLGLAFLAGLLIGLLAVERFWVGRRAARTGSESRRSGLGGSRHFVAAPPNPRRRSADGPTAAAPESEPSSTPPDDAYDLARDRSTRRQRYLM